MGKQLMWLNKHNPNKYIKLFKGALTERAMRPKIVNWFRSVQTKIHLVYNI